MCEHAPRGVAEFGSMAREDFFCENVTAQRSYAHALFIQMHINKTY